MSTKLSGALQRAQSILDSRKSASTEDLLERSQDRRMAPQHQRSRSSPTEGSLSQVTGGRKRLYEHRAQSAAETTPPHLR